MGRKPKLPHGMTENMMKIVEVSLMAQKNGTKSYGKCTSQCDTSSISVKKKEKPLKYCAICGADITGSWHSQKYCAECSQKKSEETKRAYAEKMRQMHPKKVIKCEMCGVDFVKRNNNHKYCDDCRKKRQRQFVRESRARQRETQLKNAT